MKLFAENADQLDLDVGKCEETQCGKVSLRELEIESQGSLWHQVVFKANTIENDLGDPGKLRKSSMIYTMRPKRK